MKINTYKTIALLLMMLAMQCAVAKNRIKSSPDTLTVTLGNVEFKMIKIEGGRFVMGSYNTIEECRDEKVMHFVTLPDAYYLGETEVTQELWNEVMTGNPSEFKGSEDNPVDNVSWNNCIDFIDKLNERTGLKFRMPTEAEWEFAARGGNKSKGFFYSGSDKIGLVAWYKYNAHYQTHKVGRKKPNELGLYDMTGNVWEFVSDWYKQDYEFKEAIDPKGPDKGNQRITRGGAWFTDTTQCRVTYRNPIAPSKNGNGLGLRLALTNTLAGQDRRVSMKQNVIGWDNQNSAFCAYSSDGVFNIRSCRLCEKENVTGARVNPANYAVAVMNTEKETNLLGIYSAKDGTCYHVFRKRAKNTPVDCRFTADAKNIVVLYDNSQAVLYDLSEYEKKMVVSLPFVPQHWCLSRNGFYLGAAKGDSVYVYNMENGSVRKAFRAGAMVKSVAFSMNGAWMALTTEEGRMEMYDTRTFVWRRTIQNLGEAKECVFHPDGKYVSVLTSDRRITIVNLKDDQDREYIDADAGGITHIGCAWSLDGVFYIVYDTHKHLIFSSVDYLVPNYQQIVSDRVLGMIDEWQKQRHDESDDEYYARVNDESRRQKYIELESDVSTSLAGNVIDEARVTIGMYDEKKRVVEIRFDNLKPINLELRKDEVAMLGGADDLMFSNSRYRVDEKDNFELMYTEVTSRKSGKKFVYDRKNKRVFEEDDEKFVPLDIVRQASAEEIRLEVMKDSIVSQAMEMNLISDKTHISVKTSVEPSVNANGDKTMNYNVDFNYYVDLEYSTRDDYKMGEYDCERSEAAMAMLQCVKKALSENFDSYIAQGKKVVITLYGSADATPIKRVIPYNGIYGDFVNVVVNSNGDLGTITVTKETGVQNNGQLAFLRAVSVKEYVETNVNGLQMMKTDYLYDVTVSSQKGSEFRRIGIRFTFVDTFK